MRKLFLLAAAGTVLPAVTAVAQTQVTPSGQVLPRRPSISAPVVTPRPVAPVAAQPVPDELAPTPDPTLPPATNAVPVPAPLDLPPPPWNPRDAAELLSFVNQLGAEGLSPADYDPATLSAALRAGNPLQLNKAATDTFRKVARDLALGHVRMDSRQDWHVKDPDLDGDRLSLLLATALDQHSVTATLRGLLPTHPQYGALKAALALTPATDTNKLNRIRLNMDRWRWLPRDLGQKYIIVNVPSFYATLVENGQTRWKQRAIAGAIKTKTPQLNALATGVILNPWWEVPPSISGEVSGKKGFVAVKGKDGKVQRWRQPPGPSNALGQLKFVMPNQYNIYLHDTNARSRFNSEVRALSHGCVRTQHVVDLATELLGDDNGEWTGDRVQATLASGKSVQASFVKPVPVYIVYFSSAALNNGDIVDYSDLYKRDGLVISALLNKGGSSMVAKKAEDATKAKDNQERAKEAADSRQTALR
ncbi:hypothetical protein HMF7854_00955 [Sphingomonas ginkgonis]|uniref:L,D-TPase catalytic domain-containing protein n=1 Tax=Sphingomonas ginkgonis TaxID=2315330 RepID=A0A429V6J4_9SPHN|nr:L,D-transpeptidase family protein [Sphingomonas ginkgonis]RST29559.1 hypothetical protein HMF7854_00955 [Sphingomonas ginkgonis]